MNPRIHAAALVEHALTASHINESKERIMIRRWIKPPLIALAAFSMMVALDAAAQVKIGLMVSATGPTSAIGIPQKNTGALLPAKIGDVAVEYIQLDDGGDTTRAVQNAKKLIQENNIDALIGPSTTPNALAILPVIAEAKVPLMATVGTQSVVEPLDAQRRWVFKTTQNDDLIAEALIGHMTKNGVKTVGFERYTRQDASVTGQTLKLMSTKPDAILVAGVGGPGVLPQTTLRDQGYRGTIYQTHGIATEDFIRLGGAKVEGTILAAGPMLVIDEIPDSNPIKPVTMRYIQAYEKMYGARPATFGANTYDSGLLLQHAIPEALKKGKPGTEAFRIALRDALEHSGNVVGCQGVFNMTPTNHNGMDKRARVLITVRDGKFRYLSD
jgi:branched-chain amino acid transport system substrate-binding protein